MMCSDCGRPIAEGEQCVVWSYNEAGQLCFRFICDECTANSDYKTAEEIENDDT